MKRTFATTTLAVAVLGLGACKGGGAAGAAAKLVPDAATMIGGVNLKALVASSSYKENQALLEKGEGKEAIAAAKACNLGPDTWQSVVFGADPTGGDDKMVVILTATGAGKKANLECIGGKIKESSDKEPWTLADKDGKVVLTLAEDGGMGYAVDDNTLVIVGKDWDAAVTELIGGKGKSAADGSLKGLIGRTDMGKTFWGAGKVPAGMASGPTEGITDVAGWIDVSGGLELMVSAGLGSAADATAKATLLTTEFDKVKGMAGAVGVPAGVVDSVKIEGKDKAVVVTAKASEADLKEISKSVKSKLGG